MRTKIIILTIGGIVAVCGFLWATGIFKTPELPEKELEVKEAAEISNFSTTTIGCIIDMTVSHEYTDASIGSCFEKIRKHMNCEGSNAPQSNYSVRIYPAGNFQTPEEIPVITRDFNMSVSKPPRKWENERKEYMGQTIAGRHGYELLDEKCYITQKVESRDDFRKLNELAMDCADKLKIHNEQVQKYEDEKPKIAAKVQEDFTLFCEKINDLGQNIGAQLRFQYPVISTWTYVRNVFIRAGQDLQKIENNNGGKQITLYVFIDYLEDHANIAKSFDWPDISWKGVVIKEYRIPIKPQAKTQNTLFVQDEVVKWIEGHDGVIIPELLDFSPPQVSNKKDGKTK